MLFSQSNSVTSMPEAKMIFDSMFFTNSFASVVKSDIVMKTPFLTVYLAMDQKIFGLQDRLFFLSVFCLNVNDIKAEGVFIDNSINSLIPNLSNCLSCIFSGSTISQSDENIDDHSLE